MNPIIKYLQDHEEQKELLMLLIVLTAISTSFFIGYQTRTVNEYNCFTPVNNNVFAYGQKDGVMICYPEDVNGTCPYNYNRSEHFRTSPRLEIEIPK